MWWPCAWKRKRPRTFCREPMELDILYEDEEALVLNKPAGLVVHPTHGHYTGTIANGVVHYWAQQGQSFRFRPVHRLDQETSGVLAIAKNPYVHQQISEQMQAHEVKKEYIALVHGWVETDAGTIEGPIDRDPQRPHIRIVTPEGYPAVTHYRVERRFREATMVRLRLETGRTHQIRVHMKHLGHPLLGDKLYGPEIPAGEDWIARQALHAAVLGFIHPVEKRWLELEAPLPPDMEECIRRLEQV
ncbi:RluA family pseudouridine synthase [Paenibacillus sp. P26]|nr:RluA family pseudouridine synthase [Paenibacillus sp. P26]